MVKERFTAILLLVLLHATCVLSVHAQTPQQQIAGLQPALPVVPAAQPVPVDAAGGIGSFIDSLKGNDAAIEVIVGQGRLLTTKQDLASAEGTAVIAVGDPTVLDFEVLPNPRMIRLLGLRAGVTDLSITLADGETRAFEVHVVYDLTLLRAQLRQVFPNAFLRLAQIREHLVIEGQARSTAQVTQIVQTVDNFLASFQVARRSQSRGRAPTQPGLPPETPADGPQAGAEVGGRPNFQAASHRGQIINLIRIPGVQQVLLKVRVAELNRTAMREIGADILTVNPRNGNIVGTQIGGAFIQALGRTGLGGLGDAALGAGIGAAGGLTGDATAAISPSSTAFGIFPSGDFEVILRALRDNRVVKILAEPNLIAMNGHSANFLAGGEFPVPVPQSSGVTNNVTVEFKEFGVQLAFVPYVMDDERIRLSVTPEVSTIDFNLGTTLVVGGNPVPGLNTRRVQTTVEMRQGQTLAMAGLLQVQIEGQTQRIPGLGDLPYIGPFFSNTGHRRIEKELVVLVTPFLVQPMEPNEVPPTPGDDVEDPTDAEFYFKNRIEGRTGREFRSTVQYSPWTHNRIIQYEVGNIQGPLGFSDAYSVSAPDYPAR